MTMWRLGLLIAGVASVAGALLGTASAQSVPAGVSGSWIVQSVQPAPWAPVAAPDRRMVGAQMAFSTGNMAGPGAFACGNVQYETVTSEPRGLFQGGLAEATAERDALALGIPKLTTTYRVNCETGSFDFHQAGNELVIGYDNQILRLRRTAK